MIRFSKNMLLSIIDRLGYELRRKDRWIAPERPFSVLRYVISEHLRASDAFYFIQIGANNGLGNDPLRDIIMEFGLRGLLVEPMPDFFEKLKEVYESQPQLAFENSAIGPSKGETTITRFAPDAPVPASFYHGLARMDGDYIRARAKREGLEDHVEDLTVPTITFPSLFEKHGVKHVDLLQIDTEGYDYEILKLFFSANGPDQYPTIINWEWTEMGLESCVMCKRMLADKGYQFVDVANDVLCVLDPTG